MWDVMASNTGPNVLVLSNGTFLEKHLVRTSHFEHIGRGMLKNCTFLLFWSFIFVTALDAKIDRFPNNLFWGGNELEKKP